MQKPEALNPPDELDPLSLPELKSRLSGLKYTKSVTEIQFKGVKRAIARKKGELIISPKESGPDTLPEVKVYFCEGCEGWVEGKPEKKHVLVGEPSQVKGMEIRLSCRICEDDLGVLKGSTPAWQKYPEE